MVVYVAHVHHTEVSDLKAILDFHLGPRNLAMKAMLGEGIFTQDGARWKHSRELLRRHFVRMQYQNLEGFREHVENMIDSLGNSTGVIDLQPFFFRLTLDTTISIILGQSVESFKHETGDLFTKSFNKASLVTSTRVRLGDLYWLYAPKGFFAACKTVKTYTDQFVRDALRQNVDNAKTTTDDTFITDLYAERQDISLVRDQVLNVLLAGRDTTAAAMSYAM
jgi:cytochrome P450